MLQAGYSKKTLVQKLGIKPGHRIALVNPPENYIPHLLTPLPPDVELTALETGALDVVQFFATSKDRLESEFPLLKQAIAQHGMLWVCWPKQTSKVPTDLDGNVAREIGLKFGLVDIKICAIDQVWSGLKFVYRVKDRN